MNTSAFQCSLFISMMMVVVVYSASVHNCPSNKKDECVILLRHIKNASEHLLKQNLRGWVPKVYNETCTAHFFCLAEKVLENITSPQFEHLRKSLDQYNNMTNETHCPLNFNRKYQLHEFLKNVSKCTDRLLYHHEGTP